MGVAAAKQASQVAMSYFERSIAIEWKGDVSPVTVADREAEQNLRNTLLSVFPGDGFLGEEFGETPSSNGFRWIVDPIDGTRSFVRGIPLWGTLVGLEYRGEPIAGVAVAPALGGQTWRALRGDGAFRDDRPIRVTDVPTLDQSILFYTGLSWFLNAGQLEVLVQLVSRVQKERGGGDFYGFVLVAQGSGELMVEHGVHAWDVAALLPIVEEAGGKFSAWDGSRTIHRPDVIASNGRVHEEALTILQRR
jgi:histidinol-phosphatase